MNPRYLRKAMRNKSRFVPVSVFRLLDAVNLYSTLPVVNYTAADGKLPWKEGPRLSIPRTSPLLPFRYQPLPATWQHQVAPVLLTDFWG